MIGHSFDPGSLTLVGAGPGDPELITLKGIRALESADAVLYDALTNPVLLDHAPASADRLFVGKLKGRPSMPQEEINELIAAQAEGGRHVVRLKGGDPFVFGRGMEELLFAHSRGIRTAVIPGVSASVAAPGTACIPVTHRGVSDSFWVLTGNTADGHISADLDAAIRTNATVVILMGLAAADRIGRRYTEAGKADLPAAIIFEATMPGETVLTGPVGQLGNLAAGAHLSGPATIIIGNVVKLRAMNERTSSTLIHHESRI
jgi:uroporphyrin-III C-methyltransferase